MFGILKHCFVILFLFSGGLFVLASSNDNQAFGLLFKSNEELIDNRTSLDLFCGKYQHAEDEFSLSFDISVWDAHEFGYVFRLINEKADEISLVFVNFKGEDSLYFDFNSSITNSSIQIPIDTDKLNKREWLHIAFEFNLSTDEVIIFFSGKKYTCKNTGLKNPDKLMLVYGLYGINLDVPKIALRNIEIKKGNQRVFFFPLDESEGTTVHDTEKHFTGCIKNPEWIIDKHFKWKLQSVFQAECMAGITFNDSQGDVIVVNSDTISLFNIQSGILSTKSIKKIPFTIHSGEAVYNEKQNKCYVYNLAEEDTLMPSLAIIDMLSVQVEELRRPLLTNRLHHHNVFPEQPGDTLCIFGGYGDFSYSDKLYKYRPSIDSWVQVPLSGDTIFPRFFSAVGKGVSPDEMLIFGGFGNQSGRQEHGGRNMYDLFVLNTNTNTLTKKWEITSHTDLFVPCGNLIINKEHTHFYTLCYPHHKVTTKIKLYKFSLLDGFYEEVGDEIPFVSEKIESNIYLFYDSYLQEYVAVTRKFISGDRSEIKIYTLFSPPAGSLGLQNNTNEKDQFPYLYLFISIVLILTVISIIYFCQKKKNKCHVIQNLTSEKPLEVELQNYMERKINAIYVLGEFAAFDKNGVDITHRFSAKLKSLFALVLLNSVDGNTGISTDKLTLSLWPERELSDAKNIRGVTINHLRSIISDIEGIQLVSQNSRWTLTFSRNFYCDYIEVMELGNQMINTSNRGADISDELFSIIRRGPLLHGLDVEWADSFKLEYESHVENVLKDYILLLYRDNNYSKVVFLSDVFFAIDPFNEEILSYVLNSLKRSGKTARAYTFFNRFCLRYKISMGEDYSKSYQSVLDIISNPFKIQQ